MEYLSLQAFLSALIFLAPIIYPVDERSNLSYNGHNRQELTDDFDPQIQQEGEQSKKSEHAAASSKARNEKTPATDQSTSRSSSEIRLQAETVEPEFDWPAPIAAKLVGLPSLNQRLESPKVPENQTVKKQAVDAASPEDRKDKKKLTKAEVTKLVSQSTKPNAERTVPGPPFSETIIKLNPNDRPKLNREMEVRMAKIAECLKYHYVKPVNADVLRPWSIMHGVLAYGQDSMVVSRGKRINAVDYLCQNGIGNDRRLLLENNGKLSAAVGVGLQGHEGQLLAILAQVRTPLDKPLYVNRMKFTVRDLVEYEKSTCRPGTELTFKLIGLSVYLQSEAIWKDNLGQAWDISRLMHEEMSQPINGAACGGTHRLMGLSYALAMRKAGNEPINGQWKRAENFIANYHRQALALQTADGGFSTEFFEGMSTSADPIRQIYSTGHVLEWFAISMSNEQLVSAPVTKMVDRLLELLAAEHRPQEELNGTDVGPKGHALRALRLYELRVLGKNSNYLEFRDLDPRPIISAEQIAALQQNQRTVLPSSIESPRLLQSSHSNNPVSDQPSMPIQRGGRFLRRR